MRRGFCGLSSCSDALKSASIEVEEDFKCIKLVEVWPSMESELGLDGTHGGKYGKERK
jgi:hypothetical protein